MRERAIDRSNWPKGTWDSEPDRVEWRSGDIACLLVRNNFGAWCGYVGVPPGHPWHGKDYNDIDVDIHGGLTYGAPCREDSPICHVARPSEPQEVFWLGFDCAHCNDLTPGDIAMAPPSIRYLKRNSSYRDQNYARREVEKLADQARAAVRS